MLDIKEVPKRIIQEKLSNGSIGYTVPALYLSHSERPERLRTWYYEFKTRDLAEKFICKIKNTLTRSPESDIESAKA